MLFTLFYVIFMHLNPVLLPRLPLSCCLSPPCSAPPQQSSRCCWKPQMPCVRADHEEGNFKKIQRRVLSLSCFLESVLKKIFPWYLSSCSLAQWSQTNIQSHAGKRSKGQDHFLLSMLDGEESSCSAWTLYRSLDFFKDYKVPRQITSVCSTTVEPTPRPEWLMNWSSTLAV